MAKGTDESRSVAANSGGQLGAVLPRRWLRLLATLIGVVVGAGLGIIYARAVSTQAAWVTLAVGGVGGAALGYLAVAIPRIALHFLLREWYRTVAGHWRALIRQRAERAWRQLKQEGSETASALDLGVASYLLDHPGRASEHLQPASSGADPSPELLNALAVAEASQGHWQDALEALAKALKAQPDHRMALHNLTVMLAQMPHDLAMPAALESVVEHAGAGALNNVAVRHVLQGDPTAAREHLQRALTRQPLHAAAHANLGVLAFRDDDPETAVVNLAAAAQFAATDADVLSALGAVLAASGDHDFAEAVLRRALRLDARHLPAVINQGCVLILTGRTEEATELLARMPADHPLTATAEYNAATAWAAEGEWARAREYAEKAAADRPDDPRVLATLGAIHWQLKEYEEADDYLSKALQMGPDQPEVLVSAARTALSAGREDAALQILENMPDDAPGNLYEEFDLGVCQLVLALRRRKPEMNRTEQDLFKSALNRSIGSFEQVLRQKDGPVGRARLNLGLGYYLLGELEAAGEHFEAAAKLLDGDVSAQFCAGTAFALAALRVQEERGTVGDELVGEARQLLRRARQHLAAAAEDHHADADVFSNLGTVCYQLGQTEEAMKALRRLVQLEASAAASNSLALAFARQGQEMTHRAHAKRTTGQSPAELLATARRLISSAIHYFSQALQVDPINPVLHSNIGLAYMLRNGPNDLENALHHWHLMRSAGDAWAERQFARMMQVMENQQTARAQFHDVGQALRPIAVDEHIRRLPPSTGAPMYVVEPVVQSGLWEMEAGHRDLQVALRARRKLELLQKRLQRLSI